MKAVCPLCEQGIPLVRGMHHTGGRYNPSLHVACPLYRRARKPRAHRDTWLRREQHLFDANEVRLKDSEVPR